MDIRQSPEWANFLKSLGWQVEKVGSNYAFCRNLPLLGSIIKVPRASTPINFEAVDALAKKRRALFVKIEPKSESLDVAQEFVAAGYQEDNWTLSSSKT